MAARKGVQKELKIRIKPNTALYEVYFDNGGELPAKLQSLFTCVHAAKVAINEYEAGR